MPKTKLSPIRVLIREGATTEQTSVELAYDYTSSDGDVVSRTRDLTEALTAAQKASITNVITSLRTKVTATEGIV